MGPRSWDRGESAASRCRRAWAWTFNGAAVLGPRRAPSAPARRCRPSRLQWGRGLGTAERGSKRRTNHATATLQWGRGLGTAESSTRQMLGLGRLPLQWGRGLGTAERQLTDANAAKTDRDRGEEHRATALEPRSHPFNGAAVLGPRRASSPSRCRSPRWPSMGPRSWDRGEPRQVGSSAADAFTLQWGRGLGTAERDPRRREGAPRKSLQWGRGLGTAESNPPFTRGSVKVSPSMGPRSWDRGEAESGVAGSGTGAGLQWGRGLGTAESVRASGEVVCHVALQWGRGLGTAERIGGRMWTPVA